MRAILSVWDKTGLPELGRALVEMGWEIISTGGTFRLLEKEGIEVTPLSEYTGFQEILDGKHDDVPEQAFYMVGTIESALEKAKTL